MRFGNGANGGSPGTLYFADGINGETAGLFAALAPIPEPSTAVLAAIGLLALCGWRRLTARRAA